VPNDWNAGALACSDDNILDLKLPKRADSDYEIEAVSKARLIIETLVEEQPITDRKLAEKLGFKKDLVMRTLRTYRIGGWAIRDDKTFQWSVGARLKRLGLDIR
jgi:hypothetical protein